MKINKSSIRLYPSAKAVIEQFLYLPGENRVKNVIERIKNLSETEVQDCLAKVIKEFTGRHRNIEEIFWDHFEKVSGQFKDNVSTFSHSGKLLLGAFFTKEYSIQAAAIFNPSIVSHPDQQGLKPGEQRFIMSLRATGEGHISSIIFKTGTVDGLANIILDKEPHYFTRLKKNNKAAFNKDFIKNRIAFPPDLEMELLKILPENFTHEEALRLMKNNLPEAESVNVLFKKLAELFESNYDLQPSSQLPINEKVIFPASKSESMGMEDVRFVKFIDRGAYCYYGTYTAYDGSNIKTKIIQTKNFDVFKIRTLYGDAISDKGMALFPEKVNGKYVMISRQGGEKMNIMFSEDLYLWNNFQLLMEPKYTWEFLQLGNCGSPLKTDKGWLLLIHGVGTMRTYVISAILLDLADPSKVIGRLDKPLIKADETERDGYVPNVVYTCGLLRHKDFLIIPYAVSDSATGFATIDLNELLNEMNI